MAKLKQRPAMSQRLAAILLVLVCMLGLLPSTALAAGPDTIVMEDCTHNGVYYESAALDTCWLHQMTFDYHGDSIMGFCRDHGMGMGWSLEGLMEKTILAMRSCEAHVQEEMEKECPSV